MTINTALYQRSGDLLRRQLSDEQIRNILAPVGFDNWQAAYKTLQKIAGHSPQTRESLAGGLPVLLPALTDIADPNRVLVSFERFIATVDHPVDVLNFLAEKPRGFNVLVTLFAGSQFLTEIVLRTPPYFDQLIDPRQLSQTRTPEELRRETEAIIEPYTAETAPLPDLTPALDDLRRFQLRQLLRIGTADLLGLLDLPSVTLQLSYLADSLAHAALLLAAHQSQTDLSGFAVIGMGKLGGEELNYSSDIDLVFVADEEPNKYWKLGQTFIDILDRSTNSGFLYRVDMRLRPWGKSGALVYTADAHISYLKKSAGLWERQALLKARVIAGSQRVGQYFLVHANPFIFDMQGASLRVEIHKLKQRIEGRLRKKGRNWGEVKLGQGSIRDIEFVVQYLQLAHGPNIKFNTPTTLKALTGLASAGHLSTEEYRVLTDGYIFLRTAEHHLQLMHYRQTHTLPKEAQALNNLARRLGFEGSRAGKQFSAQYKQHSAVIRAVYQRHLADTTDAAIDETAPQPDVLPLLVRMSPSYATTFSDTDIEQHARLIEKLNNNTLVKVEAIPLENNFWQVSVVGYDYLGVLSLICGLLVVYGLDIVDGNVFTYGPSPGVPLEPVPHKRTHHRKAPLQKKPHLPERKIVDVFTVRPVQLGASPNQVNDKIWSAYAADLTDLFQRLHQGDQRKAQGKLAKKVADAIPRQSDGSPTLTPVDIEIDNEISARHTVLQISGVDTFGFLYEFTNALALVGINIRQVTVASEGKRLQDTLYVTDAYRNKITAPEKQRELRAATVLIKHFTHLLPRSPNPEAALLHFREYVAQLFTRPNWPDELASLKQTDVLDTLARLLGVSDFLWNDFLRMQHANLFPLVRDVNSLAGKTPKAELREELAIILHNSANEPKQQIALNAFKDREMFRIDMRRIQGHIEKFGQFSDELTDLAEVVVEAAYQMAGKAARRHFGLPRRKNGTECPLSVCALGKCGGRELGFASDIELMFIFASPGRTSGPRVVTNSEYFTKIVQEVNRTIQTKREGIFELDLRLRPYGGAGSMSVSMDAFRNYFGPGGDAWPYERQALVKLRPIAGDLKFGQQIVRLRDELIYTDEPFDVFAMRAMRERQLRHLVKAGTLHAKFSPGALVDAEYLVQGLQITYGHLDPSLRHPNTRVTMRALAAMKIIPPEDYPRLQNAYNFLRKLINALRMVRGNAKDLTVPPPDDEAFAFLARRLEYGNDLIRLQNDLYRHTSYIQKLSSRLLM